MESPEMPPALVVAELKSLLADTREQVIVIDVRNPDEYERLHIPFAKNIPVQDLEQRLGELQSATRIVTACGSGGNRCKIAAAKLRELGFPETVYLSGGTVAWHDAAE